MGKSYVGLVLRTFMEFFCVSGCVLCSGLCVCDTVAGEIQEDFLVDTLGGFKKLKCFQINN